MRQLSQLASNAIALDHVGHWVPDAHEAYAALTDLGFVVSPFSEQQQRNAHGDVVPAGAGNYCVMLENGYLEFLTPLADTPIGRELSAGIARYVGPHIAAYAVTDTNAHSERLQKAGFDQAPVVSLSRAVEDAAGGTDRAAFTVARPLPPGMPEGRFQLLTHHTPQVIWQQRWMTHPNAVTGLVALVVLVESLTEATDRFSRWFATPAITADRRARFELAFGQVVLTDSNGIDNLIPVAHNVRVPGIAATVLSTRDTTVWSSAAHQNDLHWKTLPTSLGGAIAIVDETADLNAALAG